MYRTREVDGQYEDIADALAELHRRTFFNGASLPNFEYGHWWLAYDSREPVAFAGLVPSTHAENAGYFCRVGVFEEALRPRASICTSCVRWRPVPAATGGAPSSLTPPTTLPLPTTLSALATSCIGRKLRGPGRTACTGEKLSDDHERLIATCRPAQWWLIHPPGSPGSPAAFWQSGSFSFPEHPALVGAPVVRRSARYVAG
jgi:hypothetical protein